MNCPSCFSENTELVGYEDGAGDYGEAVSELWRCLDCDERFDGQVFGEGELFPEIGEFDKLDPAGPYGPNNYTWVGPLSEEALADAQIDDLDLPEEDDE